MKRRVIRTVIIFGLAICFLFGCSSAAEVGSTQSGGSGNKKEDRKERAMTFWHWDTDYAQVYERLAQTFMDQTPGLTIEITAIPQEEYLEQWTAAAAQKRLPDLFAVPAGTSFETFSSDKALKDLTDYSGLPDSYDEELLKCGVSDGKVKAIPVTVSVPVIFYQRSIFDHNRLEPPLTVTDFMISCDILYQQGENPFALAIDEQERWILPDFTEGLLANGYEREERVSETVFLKPDDELEGAISGVSAMAFELLLSDWFLQKENAPQGNEELLMQFVQGEYAMIPGNSKDLYRLQEHLDLNGIGMFNIPGMITCRGVMKADLMLGISTRSKATEDAEQFIEYLLTQENQKILADETWQIPVIPNIQAKHSAISQTQELLYGEDGNSISVFQRLPQNIYELCVNEMDSLFSAEYAGTELFLINWKERLKEIS